MDSEQERPEAEDSPGKRPDRCWTERVVGEVRYRRISGFDATGKRAIIFQFDLPAGQSELPQAIYDAINECKMLPPNPNHGKRWTPTGLQFHRSKPYGRVWRFNDNPQGRTAADMLDHKLQIIAERLEGERGPTR